MARRHEVLYLNQYEINLASMDVIPKRAILAWVCIVLCILIGHCWTIQFPQEDEDQFLKLLELYPIYYCEKVSWFRGKGCAQYTGTAANQMDKTLPFSSSFPPQFSSVKSGVTALNLDPRFDMKSRHDQWVIGMLRFCPNWFAHNLAMKPIKNNWFLIASMIQ